MHENDKTEIDDNSPITVVIVFAFEIDSDAVLLGGPSFEEHSERLHRHHWKVKISSLLASIPIFSTRISVRSEPN